MNATHATPTLACRHHEPDGDLTVFILGRMNESD